jgi:hypothetical protein
MLFLIVYSRRTQRLLQFQGFSDAAESDAQKARLQAELDADPAGAIESVLIRASSEAQLRNSHARYFENAGELLRDLKKGA